MMIGNNFSRFILMLQFIDDAACALILFCACAIPFAIYFDLFSFWGAIMLKIILSITNDNISASGAYIDNKDKRQAFARRFNDEETAMEYLHEMRDNQGCEFSIVINRSM